jgi:SOS-response transcriptional repressor LexA
VLIIDPNQSPKLGDFVIAKVEDSKEVIVRRYKQLTAIKNANKFELIAVNTHWGSLQNNDDVKCELLGTVVSLNRKLRKNY